MDKRQVVKKHSKKPGLPKFKGKKPDPDKTRSIKEATILVVDDSEGMRKALKGLFSDYRYVMLAENHEVAVEVIRGIGIDLVISDMRMPRGTEGLDLLKWVKKHSPGTKFILMSADMTDSERKKAQKMGADAIIDKNTGTAGFVQPVADVLDPGSI